MLRGRIGTEVFWEGIRECYRQYQNSNASTGEFRRVIELSIASSTSWAATR